MKKIIYSFLFLSFASCTSQETKINGISFVASNKLTTENEIKPMLATNANWVALMPFAFMRTITDTTIYFNSERQWIGERKEGIEKASSVFKENKISVMLKPQIWIPNGFTGHIQMKTEAEWEILEKNYENFILFYAEIAQQQNIDLFCIGTELNAFVINRSQFWNELIIKIKKRYTGKLTYAENWDTYQSVPFFKNLDYIGIDAYFPLANEKTPSISQLEEKWDSHKVKIKNLAEKLNKKVLFTEFGYQSIDYTTHEPWDFSKEKTVNLEAQSNALQALFNTFWGEDWFAGGFLWKWYDYSIANTPEKHETDYTVQNKPALKIIKIEYKKMR